MVKIAVLGASGHTGRFVIAELNRHGVDVIAATRTGDTGPGGRVLDFTSPASLDEALAGADAVINCAGPFLDTSEPAARAAIRANIPYFDVTAEQMAALTLFEKLDSTARLAGVPLVPAMGFYGGLADILATALVPDGRPIDSIQVAIALSGWNPTAGTRRTGERNTHQRLLITNHELTPLPSPPPTSRWEFPAPFGTQSVTAVPLSEIILVHRHLRPTEMTTYLNDKPLADLRDEATPPPESSDKLGRSTQRFLMEVRVSCAGSISTALASGRDIYWITASLVVAACLEVLRSDRTMGGVFAPGELIEPKSFLRGLAPALTVAYRQYAVDFA